MVVLSSMGTSKSSSRLITVSIYVKKTTSGVKSDLSFFSHFIDLTLSRFASQLFFPHAFPRPMLVVDSLRFICFEFDKPSTIMDSAICYFLASLARQLGKAVSGCSHLLDNLHFARCYCSMIHRCHFY